MVTTIIGHDKNSPGGLFSRGLPVFPVCRAGTGGHRQLSQLT